jgi:hypothetical protein
MLVKHFIHNMKCEMWQFDASPRDKDEGLPYIDKTDDKTGEPCSEAQANPMIYANEISCADEIQRCFHLWMPREACITIWDMISCNDH